MITDPLKIYYNEKRKKYFIKRGNETFYDLVTREWIMFNSEEEALSWINGFKYGVELQRTNSLVNPLTGQIYLK